MKADQSKITLHAKMENIYWSNKSMIERVIIVSWLIKDMSWMATIVVLGYFFGVLSIFLHLFLLVCDNRVAMRFHHASLFLWVVGNFFWMTLEFTSSAPSSHVHIGLDTPTGGITNSTERFLVYAKHWLFLTSVTIQIALYIFLFNGRVNIPGDDPEPPLSEKDCQRTVVGTGMNKTEPGDDDVTTIQFQNSAHHSPNTRELKRNNQKNYARLDIHQDMDVEESANPSGGVSGDGTLESERIGGWSMVLIENFYVIFWIGKDLFWSWSTGDFGIPIFETMICETFAITFGTLACCSFLYVGFLYRHNLEYFLDSVTSVCWLLANFVWMVGEFFIRYDNMEFDDQTEHNDTSTRVLSLILFLSGIVIQLIIVGYYAVVYALNGWQAQSNPSDIELCVVHNTLNDTDRTRPSKFTITDSDDEEEVSGRPSGINYAEMGVGEV